MSNRFSVTLSIAIVLAIFGVFAWRGHGSDERLAWAASDSGSSGVHFAVEGLWNEQIVISEDDAPVSDATLAYLAIDNYSDRFRAVGFRTVRVGDTVMDVRQERP
jgi:hypothetical protein